MNLRHYRAIFKLLGKLGVKEVVLKVMDQAFNRDTANMIEGFINKKKIQWFTLDNIAAEFGVDGDEYEDFEANVESLKENRRVKALRWGKTSAK